MKRRPWNRNLKIEEKIEEKHEEKKNENSIYLPNHYQKPPYKS